MNGRLKLGVTLLVALLTLPSVVSGAAMDTAVQATVVATHVEPTSAAPAPPL